MIDFMFASCFEKQKNVKQLFKSCQSPEEIYQKIILLGKSLSPISEENKTSENLVTGCQSEMFLISEKQKDLIIFGAYSEALISAGLAYLMISVYSYEPIEIILKCPPLFLEELGIIRSLSPSRSNGLSSLHLKMKKDIIKFLV